ncbi:MAG: anthranilate phosphoribosyltransferase [Candidatus Caenarcaniphilales bacterium]|nr:anthranilate phosphoribosyltransferase [Candidatus Caenarcaniphilales bacterium]
MSTNNFQHLIKLFSEGKDLDEQTAKDFISCLADPETTEEELAELTKAWKAKGETPQDLASIAKEILSRIETVEVDDETIDCCGTGGDNSHTFNISTASAFLAASLGLKVAKHGGRKTTSKSGSIDFLEALGVSTIAEPKRIKEALGQSGLVFIASPANQKLLGRWKGVCGKLGFYGQTGLIGTLTNPVNLTYQIIGVAKPEWGLLMAESLKLLGRKKALIVHGSTLEGGLDEASLCGSTLFWKLENDEITQFTINPQEFGINKNYELKDIKGGNPEENAKTFLFFLEGKTPKTRSEEAIRETIFYNTALLLWIYGKTPTIKEGIQEAKNVTESGKALLFWKDYVVENFR